MALMGMGVMVVLAGVVFPEAETVRQDQEPLVRLTGLVGQDKHHLE